MDKLNKLLALAFDPASADGEATAAFCAARRLAHSAGQTWFSIVGVPSSTSSSPRSSPPRRRSSASPKMPFGQYKGRRLWEIAEDDPDYLEWLLTLPNIRPALRRAVKVALRNA